MLSDQELISLMVSEPSWEDVIFKIVTEEGMDEWAIDICRLADVFGTYLAKMDRLDLRVPARFILITAILLRMKSDILTEKRHPILIPEGEKPEPEWLRALASIPPLQPPIKRVPLGAVSLDELMGALRKAFEVKERRERRKEKIREIVDRAVPAETADISKRIDSLLAAINAAIADIEGSVEFSKLLGKWEREEIVSKLTPLLHLSQAGKVSLKQEDLFKEIYVELKKRER